MSAAFPFDEAQRRAAAALTSYRKHRDFEDLVSEAVLRAWKMSQSRPEMPLGVIVTMAARWTTAEWFGGSQCGDIIAKNGARRIVGRISVETVPWQKDGEERIELEWLSGQSTPDFSSALIDQISAPPQDKAKASEHRPSELEMDRRRAAQRRKERDDLYARTLEKDRRFGEYLLMDSQMMAHHRKAIRLHYIEGWSMSKVCRHIGMSDVHVYEAIRKSRQRLEQQQKTQENP